MNTIILCEGKTDAIFLSYLLINTSGWKYLKKRPKSMNIEADDRRDESANWYERGNEKILICSVGGKNNFESFFKNKIYPIIFNNTDEMSFEKLVYIVDKDEDVESSILTKAINDLNPICVNAKNNEWEDNSFKDSFNVDRHIKILCIIVPYLKNGALEDVMLDSLSEDIYNKNIIEKSRIFVENIKKESNRYISSKRLELKALLSVVFAIISPQKVFSMIDELINSIKWEHYENVKKLFSKLIEM